MSEQPATPSTAPAPEPKGKKPKRGKWKRRLLKTLFGLGVFFIVFRVGMFFLLAFTLRKVANFYDLDVTYERQEITVLGGDAGLWGVHVSRRGETTPLLEADYVHGNLSVLALLRTHIEVWRLEADGVTLNVTREADGKIPLMDLVMAQMASKPVAASVPDNTPIDLTSPLKVDAMRLHRLRVHVNDLAVTPAFHDTLNFDLRVSDLLNPAKPIAIEADIWSDSILSTMRFNGTGESSGRVAKLDASFRGSGLNLQPLSQYLEPLGLKPIARSIDWGGKLKLSTDAGPTPKSLTARLDISDINALADSSEVISVKSVSLSAKSIDANGAALGNLTIDGVRVRADRASDGRLRFAGIELASPPPTTRPTVVATATTKPVTPTTAPAASPIFVTLDSFTLRNVVASFGDAAISPATVLSLDIDELTTREIARDEKGRVVVPITGTLRAPGIAGAISISGSIQPFVAPYEANVNLKAAHIKPDALLPYLAPLGLTSTLEDASLDGSLSASAGMSPSGSVDASVKLTDVVLQDRETRIAMPLVRAEGVQIAADASAIIINDVELVGPELSASREADGTLRGLGMRYQASRAVVAPAAATTKPTVQLVELPALPELPRVELKRLKWSGTRISLTDAALSPPRTFELTDIGADLADIVVDLTDRPDQSQGGTVKAWLSLAGMANKLAVDGTIARSPSSMRLNVDLSGEGLNSDAVAPYLAPLGVLPQLSNGSLALKLGVELMRDKSDLAASVTVGDLTLKESANELAGLQGLTCERVRVENGALAIRSITIDSPRVSVTRLKDGSLRSAGILILPTKSKTTPAPGPVLPIPYSPVPLAIDTIRVTGASATWADQSTREPVSLHLKADATLSKVRLSLPGDPANFEASGSIDGVAEHFAAKGQIDVDPAKVLVNAHVEASGLTGSAIDPYLPPGTNTSLGGASFVVDAAASILPVDETGQSMALSLRDLKLSRGEAMLAGVPAIDVNLPLIDLVKNEVAFDTIHVQHAALADVRIMKDGAIELPGIRFGAPPADAESAKPDTVVVSADGVATSDAEIAAALATAGKPLPIVRINHLDIGVDHVGVYLDARPGAAPVALENLHVTNGTAIQIGGAKAADLPPVLLKIQTGLSPLVKQVDIDLSAAPFAGEASFSGSLSASRIDGKGLIELIPEIAGLVDGSGLTDGSFQASFDAKLRVNRRTPTDFDLRRGFDAEVTLADVRYRVDPASDAVAGIESIMLEGVHMNPSFNGGTVKLMTVNKPMARLLRDEDGIHVLGWTIRLPTGEATTRPSEPADPTTKPDTVLVANTPAPAPSGPEFKIDKLLVSGGDVLMTDTSVEPALVVPINALDVEVKGLSNRALLEDRTIRFSALVGTDKVELPTRARKGETADTATEQRPLLSQVTATGQLKLFPALEGYAKASVSGFEMQSLAGEAKAFGITLGDGIFDGSFDARFQEGGNLNLKSKLIVTDLKMSEQPNGLVQRTLGLQAPIDAVIGMVEDPSGSITLPLEVKLKHGEVDMGSIYGSAIAGVAQICTTAMISAPVKLLQGLGGDAKPEAPRPPVTLAFLPGDTSIEPALRRSLDALILAMRKEPDLTATLSHKLSTMDVARAAILASPTAQQIDQITAELRAQRMLLINRRAIAAAGVSADLGSGGADEWEVAELRALDQKIVANDDSLERLLDMTRPGANLLAGRRTKAAAIDIASARLEAVRAYLLAARIERPEERISAVNARFEVDETLTDGGLVSIEQTAKKRAK